MALFVLKNDSNLTSAVFRFKIVYIKGEHFEKKLFMKIIDQDNRVQVESLLNECKGNLFEYLVAQNLSKHFKTEGDFLLSMSSDFKKRLQFYEHIVKTQDNELFYSLIKMAHTCAEALCNGNIFDSRYKWNFKCIGKLAGQKDLAVDWGETDILAQAQDEQKSQKWLSLKLSKDHSFTNTKSAGVKSFLEKYFSAIQEQNQLSAVVDQSFQRMGHNLYELIGKTFTDRFDEQWIGHYTELPGELSPEMRKIVHENYFRVAQSLHHIMVKLYQENPKAFYLSLKTICGFSHQQIVQIHAIHKEDQIIAVDIYNADDLFIGQQSKIHIGSLKDGGSSFDVEVDKVCLQVRIKPMNKFTTASYKVNCSLKIKS
jgi:hypothetical protein